MAILSSDKTYVTVQKGDTLSAIARDYKSYSNNATYQQLAAINNIPNPDLIYVNQKIKLVKSSSGSGSGTSVSNAPNSTVATKVTLDHFGIQSNSDNTLFLTWSWDRSNTANYEVEWTYDTGDGVWFVGSRSTTEEKQATYSIPANAKRVRVRVKPISKTYTSNNKETSYWTASWSGYKNYVDGTPLETPSTPTVEIDKYKLTATLDNIKIDEATHIEFQVVKNNAATPFSTKKASIVSNRASYAFNVDAGGEYKVRCRAYNSKSNTYSEWSDYSSNVGTIPSTPSGITTIKATSETSVYLEWSGVVTAKTYDIEYTTEKRYFDNSDQTTTKTGVEFTHFEISGLESGDEYFFRVRAVNDDGYSSWSGIKSVIIGKKPSAPTTWSSSTTVVTGEDLTLYWVHNAEDGSSQTYAELELTINGVVQSPNITIKNSTDEEEKDKTSFYAIKTSQYVEGTVIQWRVRTAGITLTYGDWSVQRTVDIYAPPTLTLAVTDISGNAIDVFNKFPMYVSALAGPNTQSPIGYHLAVTSNEIYETVDSVGNVKMVNKGEQVYAKYFDTSDPLLVELSAGNIDLENGVAYTVTCTVSMNSGLTTEASVVFTVDWTDVSYTPNAEIGIDKDTMVAHIRPFCEQGTLARYVVNMSYGKYVKTYEKIEGNIFGKKLKGVITTTEEQVYYGTTEDGDNVYYCKIDTRKTVEGVTLSLYRREFDGSFTELATGLKNTNHTFVTDPHPSLDYARYRVVAVTDATGAVGFYDVPGYPVGEKAIIIQWDEEWSNFDVTNEDEMQQPPWSGSLLRLPYNIDVSDNYDQDVTLVNYVGRKNPVSYYGTQIGETATWNVEIEADDKETLYALRRLAIWMGDVYVREPSGSGYWASIKVSFSQKHCGLTIPVTLSIKRVEGGV